MNATQVLTLPRRLRAAYRRDGQVPRRVSQLDGWMERAAASGRGGDAYDHAETVREYYELCNEFMLFSWGESLHFAPLSPGERLQDAQLRHQRRMIEQLQLESGLSVIDVGCGVGGPMRRVARESGARVLGVNINQTQLNQAQALNAAGVGDMVDYLNASFMDMSALADDSFDRGYAIESTCHAPDKVGAFSEIYRVLKPGALFWGQEMCMTDLFDAQNRQHERIKRELQRGIALKDIATTQQVNGALEAAGFELVHGQDLGLEGLDTSAPWYRPIEDYVNAPGILRNLPLGCRLIVGGTRLAELLWIFPEGAADVIGLMERTADAYLAGGRSGTFTPLYCFLARKP